MNDKSTVSFSRKILIYLPAYKCAGAIVTVLKEIPQSFWDRADVLVIDNCSPDGTAQTVAEAVAQGDLPANVQVVQPDSNVDYAGSQKLAYKLALQSPAVEWVVMLHGDGQYPPALLNELEPHFDPGFGVVQGIRSKKHFGVKEETPWPTYAIIKSLNSLESGLLGFPLYEWHSGFVMYTTAFLRQVAIDRLTSTRHIDGNLLFAAESLGVKVKCVPIWKRYDDFPGFVGWERIHYVLSVFRLMTHWRLLKWLGLGRRHVASESRTNQPPIYEVISQTGAAD